MTTATPPDNSPPGSSAGQAAADYRSNEDMAKLIMGFKVSQAIYVAAELKLADLLQEGPRSSDELAGLTGSHPEALYRVLRLLAAARVLEEVTPRHFAATRLGQLLQTGIEGSLHYTALFNGSPRQWQAWHRLDYSVRTGESASRHVFGLSPWDYYAQHPAEAEIFYGFSSESIKLIAPILNQNYDFSPFQAVADIGGGFGYLLTAVLTANPHLQGILFDMPHVMEGARQALEQAGLAERTRVMAGDIFSPAWPEQAGVYILSRVIHDWQDEQAVAILTNCRRAMALGSKVLLIERIIPPDSREAMPILMSDLQMLVSAGGKERTLDEYRALFQAAGMRQTRAVPLYQPWFAIEAEPDIP